MQDGERPGRRSQFFIICNCVSECVSGVQLVLCVPCESRSGLLECGWVGGNLKKKVLATIYANQCSTIRRENGRWNAESAEVCADACSFWLLSFLIFTNNSIELFHRLVFIFVFRCSNFTGLFLVDHEITTLIVKVILIANKRNIYRIITSLIAIRVL